MRWYAGGIYILISSSANANALVRVRRDCRSRSRRALTLTRAFDHILDLDARSIAPSTRDRHAIDGAKALERFRDRQCASIDRCVRGKRKGWSGVYRAWSRLATCVCDDSGRPPQSSARAVESIAVDGRGRRRERGEGGVLLYVLRARARVRGTMGMDAHGEATRDRTMVHALRRLGTLETVARAHDAAPGASVDARGTIRVLCLGADRHEGTNPRATARAFVGVREAAWRAGVETVSVLCVGPNVKVDNGVDLNVAYDVRDRMSSSSLSSLSSDVPSRAALRVEYRTGLYHDEAPPTLEEAPDVAFAFNAGVWGYDPSDWAPTIERVVIDERTPLIVTSYTLLEAESDEDAMRSSLSEFDDKIKWVWQAEMNPSQSTEVRDLGFDRSDYIDSEKDSSELKENSAWQCVAVRG